ncbi:hypothetical protein SASPL_143427 [Salvia splendens]|uniref:Uncharacterized protein n=1 Tax=Salvia splendens TaxID=180675 RepID=A0A8X8WNV0_SALSN|nr:hypothetical protein SASPL_143427 [Salvia splendens]
MIDLMFPEKEVETSELNDGAGLKIKSYLIKWTGDHSFERRLRLGWPLLKKNIATMVLESNAFTDLFYGRRHPLQQYGTKLLYVSDLLLLGRATVEEACSLLHWLDYEAGFGRLSMIVNFALVSANIGGFLAATSGLSFSTMGNSVEPLWTDLLDCNGRNLLHDTVHAIRIIGHCISPVPASVMAGAGEPEGAEGAEAVEVFSDGQKAPRCLAGRQKLLQSVKDKE